MLQVRATGQTSSRLVWDSQAETYRGAPGGLLPDPAGCGELLKLRSGFAGAGGPQLQRSGSPQTVAS